MRVLVTGAAGYIGSILCERLLDEGYDVTALDNLTYGPANLLHLGGHGRFQFEFGDVRDENLVRRLVAGSDVVVPLAAVVGAPACDRDPWNARAINLEAVRFLNRIRSPRQLIIFPNTNSGYGAGTGEAFCTEDTPLEPISLYGRVKVQAENELLDSPNVIVYRLATVFGASPRLRLDLLVNYFTFEAITKRYLVVFQGHFRRNFIHVRDVADAFVHAINEQSRMIGRAYNAGLDEANLTKEQLALKIREYVPDFYIHLAEVGEDPDKRDYIVSNRRLREAGFVARRSLDEGIKELITSFRMLGRGRHTNV